MERSYSISSSEFFASSRASLASVKLSTAASEITYRSVPCKESGVLFSASSSSSSTACTSSAMSSTPLSDPQFRARSLSISRRLALFISLTLPLAFLRVRIEPRLRLVESVVELSSIFHCSMKIRIRNTAAPPVQSTVPYLNLQSVPGSPCHTARAPDFAVVFPAQESTIRPHLVPARHRVVPIPSRTTFVPFGVRKTGRFRYPPRPATFQFASS